MTMNDTVAAANAESAAANAMFTAVNASTAADFASAAENGSITTTQHTWAQVLLDLFPQDSLIGVFVPGFSQLRRVISTHETWGDYATFMFVLLGIALVGWMAAKVLQMLGKAAQQIMEQYPSVHVRNDQEVFASFTSYLAEHMHHVTAWKFLLRAKDPNELDLDPTYQALLRKGEVSSQAIEAQLPPRIEPNGSMFLRTRWRLFYILRSQSKKSDYNGSERDELNIIPLSQFWKPVSATHDLTMESKHWHGKRMEGRISVYTPRITSINAWWMKEKSRPVKALDQIQMRPDDKADLLKDATDHMQSYWWYEAQGESGNRGYLFAGPPGSGKTSMGGVLAGLFGLDIYVLSLGMKSLTDEKFAELMRYLPDRGCLFLDDVGANPNFHSRQSQTDGSPNFDEHGHPVHGFQMTLSCLLGSLQGIPTRGHRLVILTDNHPERLDDALLRGGRIDKRYNFTLATRQLMEGQFEFLYREIPGHEWKIKFDIKDLAKKFARELPPDEFTPSDVQNLIIGNRRDPHAAIAKAGEWGVGMLAMRRKIPEEEARNVFQDLLAKANELPQVHGAKTGETVNGAADDELPEEHQTKAGEMVDGVVGTDSPKEYKTKAEETVTGAVVDEPTKTKVP